MNLPLKLFKPKLKHSINYLSTQVENLKEEFLMRAIQPS